MTVEIMGKNRISQETLKKQKTRNTGLNTDSQRMPIFKGRENLEN